MPRYEWKCSMCGFVKDADGPGPCPQCQASMRRSFRFAVKRRSVEPHFNYSTGTVVRSERDYADQLKALSEKRSEETGMEHRYVPVDHDPSAVGVTDE